jgi:hypothetical protein
MSFINRILEFFGLKKPSKAHKQKTSQNIGTEGLIEADAALVIKEDKAVLVVDQEFKDIPSWIEWDSSLNTISITQMGGATASLNTFIPPEAIVKLEEINRILLIARYHGRRVVHFLAFVARK